MHRRGGDGARRQPAGVAARRHRADEHVAVARVGLHPHPIAEDRAAGDRADGSMAITATGRPCFARLANECGNQCRSCPIRERR